MNWISVDERLPEIGMYLIATGRYLEEVPVGWYDGSCWSWGFDDAEIDDVTHWMPLPEPPKERDE